MTSAGVKIYSYILESEQLQPPPPQKKKWKKPQKEQQRKEPSVHLKNNVLSCLQSLIAEFCTDAANIMI